jgi:hypothetical protein
MYYWSLILYNLPIHTSYYILHEKSIILLEDETAFFVN